MTTGKVFIVGAGPGDPGLITVKGMDLLREAEVLIYAGSLVNPALVSASNAAVKLDSWGMSLAELVKAMVSGIRDGKRVVRLHSGDPSLYGAIVEQIRALEKEGVSVEIVPGVSFWEYLVLTVTSMGEVSVSTDMRFTSLAVRLWA